MPICDPRASLTPCSGLARPPIVPNGAKAIAVRECAEPSAAVICSRNSRRQARRCGQANRTEDPFSTARPLNVRGD